MFNLHLLTRVRNLGLNEFQAVPVFPDETAHHAFLQQAAELAKVPAVLITVRRPGRQYATYIFSWAAFLQYRLYGSRLNTSSRIPVDDKHLSLYDEDDRIVKG